MHKVNYEWIDFMKGVAITAVIIDHLYNVFYYSQVAHGFTIYSVTLFVFLAGITSVISFERNIKPLKQYLLKRLNGILIPYIIATILYGVVNHNYRFVWVDFWSDLILFKASPPFYFILFFCQLILVAPFLYKVMVRLNVFSQIISLLPVYLISRYLTHYTEVSGIYGGGGRVLGGSYLFVFYLGMLFILLYQKYRGKIKFPYINLTAVLVSAILIYFFYSYGWLFKAWSNPPNKQAIFYSLSVFVLGYSLHAIGKRWMLTRALMSVFTLMGRQSFYIFIYHLLAIHYAFIVLSNVGQINSDLLKALWFLSFAIIVPLLVGLATKHKNKIFKILSKPQLEDSNRPDVNF